MWSQRREAQWQRLHELADILYNKDGKFGLWRQLLATQELERLRTRKQEAKTLAKNAAKDFSKIENSEPGTEILIDQLRKFGQ